MITAAKEAKVTEWGRGWDRRPPEVQHLPSALLTWLLEEGRRQGAWHHICTVEETTGAVQRWGEAQPPSGASWSPAREP